uniref:Uncharacterized protein n=1 Tax=Pyricularia oryzae (strain P131) TaxID=1143193 RepID=L7J372_PYRO1
MLQLSFTRACKTGQVWLKNVPNSIYHDWNSVRPEFETNFGRTKDPTVGE